MTTKQFIASGQYLIQEVEKRSEKGAKYFFSPDSMRFFSSRISELCWMQNSDIFFITSEADKSNIKHAGSVRAFTVRKSSSSGNITTVGEFQGYETIAQARAAIRQIVEVKA